MLCSVLVPYFDEKKYPSNTGSELAHTGSELVAVIALS